MSDLRQGVTPSQHAVLDMIETRATEWFTAWTWEQRIHVGMLEARRAENRTRLKDKLEHAITAAAILMDAADELARLIAVIEPEGQADSPHSTYRIGAGEISQSEPT